MAKSSEQSEQKKHLVRLRELLKKATLTRGERIEYAKLVKQSLPPPEKKPDTKR